MFHGSNWLPFLSTSLRMPHGHEFAVSHVALCCRTDLLFGDISRTYKATICYLNMSYRRFCFSAFASSSCPVNLLAFLQVT